MKHSSFYMKFKWKHFQRIFHFKCLPNALSLADPELRDAIPSGLCASWPGLDGVGGVSDVSRLSICICSVICMVLLTGILYWWDYFHYISFQVFILFVGFDIFFWATVSRQVFRRKRKKLAYQNIYSSIKCSHKINIWYIKYAYMSHVHVYTHSNQSAQNNSTRMEGIIKTTDSCQRSCLWLAGRSTHRMFILFTFMNAQPWHYGFCCCFNWCFGLAVAIIVKFSSFIFLRLCFLSDFHIWAWVFIDFSYCCLVSLNIHNKMLDEFRQWFVHSAERRSFTCSCRPLLFIWRSFWRKKVYTLIDVVRNNLRVDLML